MTAPVETQISPPDTEVDDDGPGEPSSRVGIHYIDVDDTHYDSAIQLWGNAATDPDQFADAVLRIALALATLRGADHTWALQQRLTAYDGGAPR